MGKFGIYFAGREIVLPSVVAQVNADAMTPERGAASRAIAVLAPAQGGEVLAPTRITSVNQIRPRLIGGSGAKLVEVAMAPSGELRGASEVYFIRVNRATPASLDLGNVSLVARNAGRIGNTLRAKRVSGADGDDLYLEDTYLGRAEQFKGLGPVLELTYAGGATNPSVTLSDNAGVKTLSLSGAATVTFSSDQLPTLDRLAEAINATAEWTARLVGPLVAVQTADLDAAATYTLSGTPKRTNLSIGAKAYEYALAASEIASAQATGGAASTASGWSFFSGGSEGPAVTTNDWLAALDAAQQLDVIGVVVGSGDLAVIAAAKAHVESMSDAKNRKEQLLYCGPDLSVSKGALMGSLKDLARGVGGARAVIAGAEPKLVDAATNRLTVYPAYYYAAMLAGMKAGNRPETPLTNKQLAIFGLSYQYTVDELEDLINSGVVPAHLDPVSGSYVVTQGITSYTKDANVIYRKIAGMDIADYLNRGIRTRLARFIGAVGDQQTVNQIRNAVVSFLSGETRSATNPEGVLTAGMDPLTGQPTPSFRNVEVVMDGFDLVGIRYEAHPVGEIAYITVTAFLTPVKIVATA